jgi:hypothetical protein
MNKNKKDKIKTHTATETKTDFSDKTVKELIEICKDKNVKGYSGKKKRGYFKLVVRQVQHTKRCVQPSRG